MSDSATYSVILSGKIKSGFNPEQVVHAFAILFKMPSTRAAGIVGKRVVLKRGLNPRLAKQYAVKLSEIGIEVVIKRDAEAGGTRGNPAAGDGGATAAAAGAQQVRIKYLVLPVIMAILGATAWYLISVKLNFELGLIAWFIGGGIGLAAMVSGSHSQSVGAICALLVVLAVLGGKYAAALEHNAEMQAFLDSTSGQQAVDFRSIYEEEMKDARLFAKVAANKDSLKHFMAMQGYSESYRASRVTDEELDYFRENTAPRLSDLAKRNPSFQEWHTYTLGDAASDVSALDLVIGGFGVFDLIFLLLGIGSAFHMASGGNMNLTRFIPERFIPERFIPERFIPKRHFPTRRFTPKSLKSLTTSSSFRLKTAINSIFTKLQR